MRLPKLTTPERITGIILDFCREGVGVNNVPVFILVKPDSQAIYGDCHGNVQRFQAFHGGSAQQGWIIWEMPDFFLQAEHHAVWVQDDGKYMDVTPKPDNEGRILFLPDSRDLLTGEKLVAPIHQGLSNDPRVKEIIRRAESHQEKRDAAFKRGEPIPSLEAILHGWEPMNLSETA
jgi:hypothetical protein